MSWSRRALLGRVALAGTAAIAGATLSACGFAPVHGAGGAGTALRGQLRMPTPDAPDDFLLKQQIERRLGPPGDARFVLEADLRIREDRVAVTSRNVAARINLLGRVDYRLRDAASGALLREGRVENFTGYSTSGTTVATLAAARDARERLVVILGDQIVARLLTDAPQ